MRRAVGALALWTLLSTVATAQTEPRRIELPRGDGSTIDISVWDRGEGADRALVVIGGSDCLLNEHRSWFGRVLTGAPTRWVVSVDKEGASANGDVCGPTYEQTSPEPIRALDHIRALNALRADLDLPDVGGFDIIATSAGGMAACAVAGATRDVASLALLSTGGGRPFVEDMRQLTENADRIDREMDRVMTDPRRGQTWLGATNPEVWWASALPLDCVGQLAGYTGEVLILHGDQDSSSPVDSARLLAAHLQESRPGGVDYIELAGAEHDLFIGSADKPPEGDGLSRALDWLASRP